MLFLVFYGKNERFIICLVKLSNKGDNVKKHIWMYIILVYYILNFGFSRLFSETRREIDKVILRNIPAPVNYLFEIVVVSVCAVAIVGIISKHKWGWKASLGFAGLAVASTIGSIIVTIYKLNTTFIHFGFLDDPKPESLATSIIIRIVPQIIMLGAWLLIFRYIYKNKIFFSR